MLKEEFLEKNTAEKHPNLLWNYIDNTFTLFWHITCIDIRLCFIVRGFVVTPHLHILSAIDLRPWMREELKTRSPDLSGLRDYFPYSFSFHLLFSFRLSFQFFLIY